MELPRLTVKGTRQQMGQQYGAHFRDLITPFVGIRIDAVETYMTERGHGTLDELFAAGRACLEEVSRFDPEGHAEHHAIAEGAGLDPVELFTCANMTDVRDILILPGDPLVLEDEGCTTALIPGGMTETGHSIQGQTWDLNGPDVHYVVAVHQLPDDGPETWTVTCAGCQTLMGMNQYGVTVGTTNLKTRGARVGVPYLSVLSRALRQKTRSEASAIMEKAPVAGSHSYWVGDKTGATEWERTPLAADSRVTEDGPVTRSNHCLVDGNIALEEDVSESSHARRDRMTKLVDANNGHTALSLSRLFADRSDGRLSINRKAEDNSGATTNAVISCNPAELEFLACRGRADQGDWVKLEFERR